MMRVLYLAYGLVAYAAFVGAMVYSVGFVIQTSLDMSGRAVVRTARRVPPGAEDFTPVGAPPPGVVYAPGPYYYGGPYWGGYWGPRWGYRYGWRRW